MQFDGFDWDDGNWPKCGKHGVGKDEIEAAFYRPDARLFEDKGHAGEESRFLMIVRAAGDHHGLFIGFTVRTIAGQRLVRPITARYMHKKEIDSYEQ